MRSRSIPGRVWFNTGTTHPDNSGGDIPARSRNERPGHTNMEAEDRNSKAAQHKPAHREHMRAVAGSCRKKCGAGFDPQATSCGLFGKRESARIGSWRWVEHE